MKRIQHDDELRISAQWAMIPLLVVALWLLAGNPSQMDNVHNVRNQLMGAYVICVTGLLWICLLKLPRIGRWLLVAYVTWMVIYAELYMAIPGMLNLLVLPVCMAVALISVRAGAVTVSVQTFIILYMMRVGAVTGYPVPVALFAIWTTFGLLGAIYYPVYQLVELSYVRYLDSQHTAEEARDRRAQFEQTLQDLRHANRQLAIDNQRMSALRAVADEAQQNKTSFVSRVSHEFRAPLNMIIGLTGLMVDQSEIYAEELPPDLLTDLRIINRNSAHLAEMINDVLDLSQTEGGHLSLFRESVDFAVIAAEAMEAVSPLILKKGLQLVSDIPPSPLTVYCDRTRIRQVLLNLLSNAARFTDTGTISIEVSLKEHELVAAVHDTGPGIESYALPHIFKPFYRAPVISQKVTGSGLGLSISREIIQHHNGSIWVESEPGLGTSFFFTLPTAIPELPSVEPGHQIIPEWLWREESFRTENVTREENYARPRIIIYDPEETLLREIQREIQAEFIITHSIAESIAVTTDHSAHAILVNTHTCTAESAIFLKQLRMTAPGTLIVACDVENPFARAYAAGAADYLIKPLSIDKLALVLNSLPQPVQSVLIVDDEMEGAELAKRLIHKLNGHIEIRIVHDGASVLSALRNKRPDLTLLDVIMPGEDGWSVLKNIREDASLLDMPVVFMTGMDPNDKPPVSESLMITLDGGIPMSGLMPITSALSRVLLSRDQT